MSKVVLDSSVLIAIFKEKPYKDAILTLVEGAVLSAVNFAEVLAKISDFGMKGSSRVAYLLALLGKVEPFTESQAALSAAMRSQTKLAGLSLGDRACLALALELGAEVYTADRAWAHVDVGCTVHLIR